jgi:phospholipase/carboxylesterase
LFFVHGKADDVIHYGYTVEAARHLVGLGADVVADVIPFLGHAIDDQVMDPVVERLRTHIPRRHWRPRCGARRRRPAKARRVG